MLTKLTGLLNQMSVEDNIRIMLIDSSVSIK